MKVIIKWLKANSIMLVNASSLVGTTAITSGLGFVYWWMAARRFSPDAIGVASASVSAVMLLGGASIFGLGTLLITELPRQPEKAESMISTALVVVGTIGAIVGLLFALIASHLSPGFKALSAGPIDVLTFSAGVSLSAVTLVLDQALIGLLKGGLQFWRNTFFAVIKLAALFAVVFWPSSQLGMKIYATWMISTLLSLGVIAINIVIKPSRRRKNYLPQWELLRKLGFPALQHHLLNLTLQAPTLLLPVMVTVLLSARANAWFYVSWMISSFVFVVPGALTTVLHAMNSAQQSTLARKARLTIGIALAVSLLANLVLQIGTKQILGLFGHNYAIEAALSLHVLVIAAFPLIIKNHYISICRIEDRIVKAMIGMLPGGIIELSAAALGAHFAGLLGLSLGWVIAICIEAMFMFPTVYKVVGPKQLSVEMEVNPLWKASDHDTVPMLAGFAGTIEAIWLLETAIMPTVQPNKVTSSEKSLHSGSNNPIARLKPPMLKRYTSSFETINVMDRNYKDNIIAGDTNDEEVSFVQHDVMNK